MQSRPRQCGRGEMSSDLRRDEIDGQRAGLPRAPLRYQPPLHWARHGHQLLAARGIETLIVRHGHVSRPMGQTRFSSDDRDSVA